MNLFTRLFAMTVLTVVSLIENPFLDGNAEADTIGVSIPLSGDASELGQKFRSGVKLAIEDLGSRHQLFIADDGCDPDLASLAASDLASQQPAIVIGLLCNEPAKVVSNELVGTKVPVIVAGARSVRLIKDREREDWNLWRMSPGDDYPVAVAAEAITNLWTKTPFAIVDDGTIYGRSFTDSLRAKLDERGMAPQFSDTFRAAQSTQAGLLRRLQRSGVTAAFIASATVEDLFTIAKNMKEFDIKLDIMTTEALAVLPFLEEFEKTPPGVKVVMASTTGDAYLEERLTVLQMERDREIYAGYAAVQVAIQAVGATPQDTTEALATKEFNTVLGKLRFNADGSSTYNPYELRIWNGTKLVKPEIETETQ
ncbi:MAG: branched-chain amino acid ABC transporter substrate-binding protein [Rhizobiaceae bacterium]